MALETTYASRNIGDIFYTLRKDTTLNGAVPCTGGEYNISDFSAVDGVNSLAYLIVNNHVPVVNYTEYSSQIKSNGVCASFGYDEVNGKIKAPTLKNVYIQAGDSATLAKYLSAGLPNITGWGGFADASGYHPTASGAFYYTSSGQKGSKGDDNDNQVLAFDASRSNSIYGKSSTVQPPSIILRPMVQLVVVAAITQVVEDDSSSSSTTVTPVTLKVPYTFVPGTEAKALEVNANFEYVLKAIGSTTEAIETEPLVHIAKTETITGQKTFSKPIKSSCIEVYPDGISTSPYIDFHYNGTESDYTARLIEASQGYLSLNQNPPSGDSSTKIATTNWVSSLVTSKISSVGTLGGNTSSWTKLQNGLILQYGVISNLGFLRTWKWSNFPTAFPNACRSMAVSWTYQQTAGDKGSTCGIQWNKTSFGYFPSFEQMSANLHWIAIGN